MTVKLASAVQAPSLYDRVGQQLRGLAGALGLGPHGRLVERVHQLLCGEAAAYPATSPPPRRSALNADGTPIQLSLTLGSVPARVGLLSDPGPPQLSASDRLEDCRERLHELVGLCGADWALASIEPLVDKIAPASDPELLCDHAGAFWLGAGFVRGRDPTLKLYVNARWGEDAVRWAHLAAFAASLGADREWLEARQRIGESLEPLGVALAAGGTGPLAGRIYMSGYGKSWGYLETLARAFVGPAFEQRLRGFGRALLGTDYEYPTRSLVCSVGIREGRLADLKVELCGHCAFDSDTQARERCQAWLRDDQAALDAYRRTLDVLCDGSLSSTMTTLHSYLGLGSGNERTLYFNPAAPRCTDDSD